MQQTEHYGLNQWDGADRILREDFNADNAKLDAALAGKLGRMEIIRLMKSDGSLMSGGAYPAPDINWGDWEYVCILVHYPGMNAGDNPQPSITVRSSNHASFTVGTVTQPGYLVVFLPMHNADAKAAGFTISDHLTPFSFSCSFQEIKEISIGLASGSTVQPNVVYFGGR